MNISLPPPFSVLPTCTPCNPCVAWGLEQKVAVATTCGLLGGMMLSALLIKLIKPWQPMMRLRKISANFLAMKSVPEGQEVV